MPLFEGKPLSPGYEKNSHFFEGIALQNVNSLAGFPIKPEMELAVFWLDTSRREFFFRTEDPVEDFGFLFTVDKKYRVAAIV